MVGGRNRDPSLMNSKLYFYFEAIALVRKVNANPILRNVKP